MVTSSGNQRLQHNGFRPCCRFRIHSLSDSSEAATEPPKVYQRYGRTRRWERQFHSEGTRSGKNGFPEPVFPEPVDGLGVFAYTLLILWQSRRTFEKICYYDDIACRHTCSCAGRHRSCRAGDRRGDGCGCGHSVGGRGVNHPRTPQE